MWHSSWHHNSFPLCRMIALGFRLWEGARAGGWGCLSIISDLCRHKVSFWLRVSHQCHAGGRPSLAKCLQLSTEGTPRGSSTIIFLLLFLDRITLFISTKSIWSYSSSTVKHFANEFSIIIPNLQTRRLRLRQQIHLVQSQTMEGHWKLIPWDSPGSLFTEQPTWSKVIFFFFYSFLFFLNK